MGRITGSMCNAGAVINMQEKMTRQGQESSVLCIDVHEYESVLDGWKKLSSTPVMCLKMPEPASGWMWGFLKHRRR